MVPNDDQLSKLQSITSSGATMSYESISSKYSMSMSDLSADVENEVAHVNIPLPKLQGIWAKTRICLSTEGARSKDGSQLQQKA